MRRGHRCGGGLARSPAKRSNLDHIAGVEFLQGDLADIEFARRASTGWNSCSTRRRFRRSRARSRIPITSHRANVDATLNVLVAARDAGVRRVVFAGSSSAYGDTPTLPKHEDMPTSPLSPYALQKVVGEQYLQMFTSCTGSRPSDPLLQRLRPAAGSRHRRTPA